MPMVRDYRGGTQADIMDRLRTIIDIAVGRHHGSKRVRHHTPISRRYFRERREATGRRAWLLRREITLPYLGIFVCVLLSLTWVGWRIIAQTAAQSLAQSHPDAA